ncbi:MAG: hypothetical protein Q8N60_04365, partial [Candidatus Diapherotrites archaeon]|nr:hypothetical protein [Candidatus Diapherotrites archaeon]
YGKRAIRKHTAKGNLIAFEGAEECKFEHYKKIQEALTGKEITPEIEKELLAKWHNVEKAALNFYFELARYAQSIGRRVVSLEPSLRKPASAFELAHEREPEGTKRQRRMDYLACKKPDISFLKRIQRLKPKMVIVASGHAIYIERKLNPAKVNYFPRIEEWKRKLEFEERLAEARLYRKQKMDRLRMRRARVAKRKPI